MSRRKRTLHTELEHLTKIPYHRLFAPSVAGNGRRAVVASNQGSRLFRRDETKKSRSCQKSVDVVEGHPGRVLGCTATDFPEELKRPNTANGLERNRSRWNWPTHKTSYGEVHLNELQRSTSLTRSATPSLGCPRHTHPVPPLCRRRVGSATAAKGDINQYRL